MRALLTGVLLGLGIVALLAAGAYWWVGFRAEEILARRYDAPRAPVAVPSDSAAVAEGERLARLRGCYACHGDAMQGKVFVEAPQTFRLIAPSVTGVAQSYSDAELARLIRHGVRRDGTGVLAMPSRAYYHLSDADVGMIIAHVRATPVAMAKLPPTELWLLGKLAIVSGDGLPEAASMDHTAPRLGARSDTTQVARGAYLARTTCGECHGGTLHGTPDAPSLARAMGYTPSQFVSLVLDGRSRDGRDLGIMRQTARNRFVRFRRDEIDAIYSYLQVMPLRAPAGVN